MESTSCAFSDRSSPQVQGVLSPWAEHRELGHQGDLTPRVPGEDREQSGHHRQYYQGPCPTCPPRRSPEGGPPEKSLVEGDWGLAKGNPPEDKTEL